MQHLIGPKGSLSLVIQVVMHNPFQDIVGGITKVERARIEIGKEELILALLAQQGHTLTQPAFCLGKGIAWDRKSDMIEHVLLCFLKVQTCRASLERERSCCLCQER